LLAIAVLAERDFPKSWVSAQPALIVTAWAEVKVPAVGLNAGAATGGRIVNVAELTGLSVIPLAKAMALTVVVY
jgi:hypothetical protein